MSNMSESDREYNRLECLKLAQKAENINPVTGAPSFSNMEDVMDRAEEYADFVSGQDSVAAPEESADLQREVLVDELEFVWSVVPSFDFGTALDALKDGERVARSGWNGADMWLAHQVPDEFSKMSVPYIFMSTAQGDSVPWLASQTDLLAEDWYVV